MNDKVFVDFSRFSFCFRNVQLKKKFTNKLENKSDFFDAFRILIEELLPYVSSRSFEELQSESNHCHVIDDDDKLELVYDIVEALLLEWQPGTDVDMYLTQNIRDEKIWQLGVKESLRLIGVRKRNIFQVLFVDYHHLIYSNEKHNQSNYKKFSFNVID